MQAFHNDIGIKEIYLARVLQHKKADEIIKGTYWENGRGCAVGCTIHSSIHKDYEDQLGIPEWLARVEDKIFEGLSLDKAKEWPLQFLDSINVGSDLNKIKGPFLIYILEKCLIYFDNEKYPKVTKSINDVINLWKKYPQGRDSINTEEWRAAADYSYVVYASYAAYYVASYAAVAAHAVAAAHSYVEAVACVVNAAGKEAYLKYPEKLLELIRDCK